MSYQKVLKVLPRYPAWLPYGSPEWSRVRAAETARRCVAQGRTNRNGRTGTCVFCHISLDLHDVASSLSAALQGIYGTAHGAEDD